MPSRDAPSTGFRFGKGIYFTDSSSKAAASSLSSSKYGEGFLILAEVALGDMEKVFKPTQFNGAPGYKHSVYGVGKSKPKLIGIKDLHSKDQSTFMPSELTVCSPSALFFNTGKLIQNPDMLELPPGMDLDQKLNDFVVYDEAQVKMSYLVHFEYQMN